MVAHHRFLLLIGTALIFEIANAGTSLAETWQECKAACERSYDYCVRIRYPVSQYLEPPPPSLNECNSSGTPREATCLLACAKR